jgi:hypothetical protein
MDVGLAGHEYCAAVNDRAIEALCKLAPLPDYAFGSEPTPEPETSSKLLHATHILFELLNYFAQIPRGDYERQFEHARRTVCYFRKTSTPLSWEGRLPQEPLSAIDPEKEIIGIGPIVLYMALSLAVIGGLRVTKTSVEVTKAWNTRNQDKVLRRLAEVERAAEKALEEARLSEAAASKKLERIKNAATVTEGQRRVYCTENGKTAYDECGNKLSAEEIAAIDENASVPKWEQFQAADRAQKQAHKDQKEIEEYQNKLKQDIEKSIDTMPKSVRQKLSSPQ